MSSVQKYNTTKGTRWRVQYRDPTGKAHTKSGFTTQREAKRWSAQNVVDRTQGTYVDPQQGKVALGLVAMGWLKLHKARVKPGTYTLDESTWRVHLRPRWELVGISDIHPDDVETWLYELPGSNSVKRRCLAQMKQLMDHAVRGKHIYQNPLKDVKLPTKPPAKKVYLSWDQLVMFSEKSAHPDIVLTLGTVGLRWGELAGLRVKDVDVSRRRFNVSQTATRVAGKIVMGTPKTGEARTVAVSKRVMALVTPNLEGKRPDALVWSQKDGTPLKPPGHGKWLDTAVKRCQEVDETFPRVTAHGLRHVAAGLLVSSGASVKVVQRQLGHASAAVTLDIYADLFDGELDAVADVFDSMGA